MEQAQRQLQDSISPATPADFPRLAEVWEASVRATHHFVAESDIEVFKPLVRDAFEQSEQLLCMRDVEGSAVGFIGVEGDEVAMLFIHPDWRGQGVGRRLIEYAMATYGATRVDVNEQNEQAVGFYRRMGFEVVGRSELDGMGKPYPLLHMRLTTARTPEKQATAAE
jgi:putative acetyltransferase